MQVRRRPIRDVLGAVLGSLRTGYFWCLKYGSDLIVLTGNFLGNSVVASKHCLILSNLLLSRMLLPNSIEVVKRSSQAETVDALVT